MGQTRVCEFNRHTAAYTAGYVTKKLSHTWDDGDAREAEFARMSRRPGLGTGFLHDVASELIKHDYDDVDVPHTIAFGNKQYPLDKHCRRLLRQLIGREKEAPDAALLEYVETMRPVYESAVRLAQSSPAYTIRDGLIIIAEAMHGSYHNKLDRTLKRERNNRINA